MASIAIDIYYLKDIALDSSGRVTDKFMQEKDKYILVFEDYSYDLSKYNNKDKIRNLINYIDSKDKEPVNFEDYDTEASYSSSIKTPKDSAYDNYSYNNDDYKPKVSKRFSKAFEMNSPAENPVEEDEYTNCFGS